MKKIMLLIVTALIAATGFSQSHFTVAYTGNGQDHMNLNILTATIDGVNLEAGDEIAAFDGTVCCGAVVLTEPIDITNMNTFATIAASKKDIDVSNGFSEGKTITYKIWDASRKEEIYLITKNYLDPLTGLITTEPTYTANASATLKLFGRINKIAVSNAGSDQNVNENSTVTLNGTASTDLDNDILTYLWTAPTGISLSSISTAVPTFKAPEVTADTNYTFSLVVNDGIANSQIDQVVITVKQVNKVAVANAGSDQSIYEGFTVQLNGTASSDGDNDSLTYLWTAPAGITLNSANTSSPSFKTPEVSKDTQFTFSLVVNDGIENSLPDQVVITVAQTHFDVAFSGNGQDHMNLNVMSASFDGITLEAGDEIAAFDNTICCGKVVLTKSINSSDINTFVAIATSKKDDGLLNGYTVGNTITYRLWDASKQIETTGVKAVYLNHSTAEIITSPSYTANASAFVKLAGTSNITPIANAGVDQVVYKEDVVTLNGSASSDPDNDVLSYMWTAPDGINLSSLSSSKPTFTAPRVLKDTTFTFTLMVNDGEIDSPADQVSITVKRKIYNQEITLAAGWNLVSFNVLSENPDLMTIFQPLIDSGQLNKVMDESGKAIENFAAFGGWKNNIGNFLATEGYRVNMKTANTLTLSGETIELPLDIPLINGWNIISYPCSDSQNALNMIQTIIDGGKMKKVMDESGKSIEYFGAYGGWKNNIGNFIPGKGYKIFMNGKDTLSMTSTVLRSANATAPEVSESAYFSKIYEGNGTDQMNINLVNLESSTLHIGDEIGIFDGANCVGSGSIGIDQMEEGYISITTSCNDGLENLVNGFIPGHDISIKLYSNKLTYNLMMENLMGSTVFEKNGSYFGQIMSKTLTDAIPTKNTITKQTVQINCYPNPFTNEVSIDIKNNVSTKTKVEIYNCVGQRIKVLFEGEKESLHLTWNGYDENGKYITPGLYLCKINDSTQKIVFNGNK